MTPTQNNTPHQLWKDGDQNIPVQLLDQAEGGQVALSCCKVCGQAEIELEESCPGPKQDEVQFHRFHFPEMHLRGEAYQLKDQGHDEAAADMSAAADALASLQSNKPFAAAFYYLNELCEGAQEYGEDTVHIPIALFRKELNGIRAAALEAAAAAPAPASDEVLAELEGLLPEVTPLPWRASLRGYQVVYDTPTPNYGLICTLSQKKEDKQAFNGKYIAAACNAAPALLARVRTAEAKVAQSDGVTLIAIERQEQIHKHGWDVRHDADYGRGELVQAARAAILLYVKYTKGFPAAYTQDVASVWPWQSDFGLSFFEKIKNKSDVDKLRVAGALIAAEIDRLQAATPTVKGGQQDA